MTADVTTEYRWRVRVFVSKSSVKSAGWHTIGAVTATNATIYAAARTMVAEAEFADVARIEAHCRVTGATVNVTLAPPRVPT